MADESERDQPTTGNYRSGELLARASDVARVQEQLDAMGVAATPDEPDALGLVCFKWTGGPEAGTAVDEVRDRCDKQWPGWRPTISPNHILGAVVDPDTAAVVVATSEDIGGPAKLPSPTTASLKTRRVTDDEGTGVTVGVIDTGAMAHPWLTGSFLAGPADFDVKSEKKKGVLDSQDGHGTFVAGIILQQAPGATIRAVRALGPDGRADIRGVAAALERLGRMGVDVVNLSLGGYTRRNEAMSVFGPALASLGPSTVVVAAAGNHDPKKHTKFRPSRKFWPAAMDDVVSVAALDREDSADVGLADFSNFGPWVTLSTFGTDVLSTFLEFDGNDATFRGWATWSGTSFAAPRVAGAIAALMTEKGVRVRTAQEAKRMLLGKAEGAPFDPGRVALGADPGAGRFLRLPPAIKPA